MLAERTNYYVRDHTIPDGLVLPNGYRPWWMLCPYERPIWTVLDTGDKKDVTIRFDVRLPDGNLLEDYPNLYDTVRRITYAVRTGPLASIDSGQAQAQVATNLITLVRWMVLNHIYQFDDLTSSDAKEYGQLAVYGVDNILNTEGLLQRRVETLEARAQVSVDDTPDERRQKMQRVLPIVNPTGKAWRINRSQFLEDSGVNGVATKKAKAILQELLERIGYAVHKPSADSFEDATGISAPATTLDTFDDQAVSTEHLRRLLKPFEYLYLHRKILTDAMRRPPFPNSSASAIAKKFGTAIGRTDTVPIEQAKVLIERSVRWILDFSPALLAYQAGASYAGEVDIISNYSPFPILFSESEIEPAQAPANNRGLPLGTALNYLLTACSIVIAAFSARRAAEIAGLKAKCIWYDPAGKPWLQVFIHKTHQRNTAIPVPEVVVMAISLLEKISETARLENGSPYLFQYKIGETGKVRGLSRCGSPIFSFTRHLRDFGYFIDVPPLPDQTRWTFRPHQFRRFFAIVYIWVYEGGNWGALSYFLRHFDSTMTKRYVMDPVVGKIFAQVSQERTVKILVDVAFGRTRVSGKQAERLVEATEKLHVRLAQKIQVVSERKLYQRVQRLIERSAIQLVGLPWSFCASSPGSTAPHICNSDPSAGPEVNKATFNICSKCEHQFLTPAFAPFLERTIQMHEKISNSSNAPEILRNASKYSVVMMKAAIHSVKTP
ncbi:hypothetical protein [Duganella sp. S19_KUP01_CR8]|uniref:hypothetical protein n=1 Tax=Duganella sp. S19_KUP01_CR8 TaxID=3025502 RepID=UPI002FCD9CD3